MKTIAGIPLIGILIRRLKKSGLPIILATSTNQENDQLIEYSKKFNVHIFRGSENNVLERYYLAAKKFDAQTIIRVTGDNPLLDGEFLRQQLENYLQNNNDRTYLSSTLSQTYPLGMSLEIFSFNLLEEAYINAEHPGELEHVTPYMYQNKPGNIKTIKPKRNSTKYHYRLTVDTPDDFLLNKKLVEDFGCDDLNMEEIIKVLDNYPELLQINKSSRQKKWYE